MNSSQIQATIDNLKGRISVTNQGLVGALARRDGELNEQRMGRLYNFSADRLAKAEADIETCETQITEMRAEIATLEASKNSGVDA